MGGRHILVIDDNQENLKLLDIMMPVIEESQVLKILKTYL